MLKTLNFLHLHNYGSIYFNCDFKLLVEYFKFIFFLNECYTNLFLPAYHVKRCRNHRYIQTLYKLIKLN